MANCRRPSIINSILELISDEIYQKKVQEWNFQAMKYSNPIKINITFPHQEGK
jgi:hypothetical protein